ncbi:hypothetical protein BN938_2967 [Mucinivorans hirudinis]|uniref:Uncharacterized protein n=1 Tax=Mucinivorans hirudinis TaxID=1433126 RepID=A0A060RBR1_9BACT|nr:hypothetical protein BN938_2967 [Mucinivorans hirudinis]
MFIICVEKKLSIPFYNLFIVTLTLKIFAKINIYKSMNNTSHP